MKKTLIASLILTGFAGAAQAASPNYDKIEFGYTNATTENDDFNFDIDSHAYNLSGSISLSDSFFLQGGYQNDKDDESLGDADIRSYFAGFGFRAAIIDNVDFNATVDYLRSHVDKEIPVLNIDESDSDSGYALGVGLRAQVTDPLELSAMVKRTEYRDADESLESFHATANYDLTTNFGLFAGYSRSLEDSDTNAWTLGARFSF